MTDGVTLNPGSGGAVVDTEVSPTTSRHMQRVKLVIGAADTDGGDVSATNPAPVADSQSAPFAGAVAMTVGTTYSAQRSVGVLATVAGNVQFQFPDASTLTLPVFVGWQTFPFAATQIVSAGTTATATYFNLK